MSQRTNDKNEKSCKRLARCYYLTSKVVYKLDDVSHSTNNLFGDGNFYFIESENCIKRQNSMLSNFKANHQSQINDSSTSVDFNIDDGILSPSKQASKPSFSRYWTELQLIKKYYPKFQSTPISLNYFSKN